VTTYPEGSVVIPPNEVYREVIATKEAVHSLSSRVEALLSRVPSDIDDHDARIRHLETQVWMAAGVVAVIALAAGIIAPLLLRSLAHEDPSTRTGRGVFVVQSVPITSASAGVA
jgi:hypothetical protein